MLDDSSSTQAASRTQFFYQIRKIHIHTRKKKRMFIILQFTSQSSFITGTNPGGTVHIDDDWEIIKPVGLFCMNLGSTSLLELLIPSPELPTL
jgi:hypothetical protein